jgi:hypothetical protein
MRACVRVGKEAGKLQDYDQHDIKFNGLDVGMSKKIKKLIKLKKLKKNN